MRDFRKRGKNGTMNFFMLCTTLFIVLILAVFAIRAAWGMYVKFTVASRGDEAAKQELKQLEEGYARMSTAVANLSTDRGQEGEIRERFGVARPGEGAIEIVRTSSTTNGAEASKENAFIKLLRALFVW